MNYLSPLLLFVFSVMISTTASAQHKLETVHLKDGFVLRGFLIEDNDQLIKLAISTGDTLEIGYKLIEHIGPKRRTRQPLNLPTDGWTIDVGVLGYLSHNRIAPIELLVGKILDKKKHLGLVSRYRKEQFNLAVWWAEHQYVDLGGFYRYMLTDNNKRIRPFGELASGLSFLVAGNNDPLVKNKVTAHASASLGVRFMANRRTGLVIKSGFVYNKVSFSRDLGEQTTSSVVFDYSRQNLTPHITIGLNF